MTGILTAIQRFSLHDGPGIRSTVFFKGCNLRCAWCHNPETLSRGPQILWYRAKCVGCGACAAVCSRHAVGEDGRMAFSRDGCTACGRCAEMCFSGALEKCGHEATVQNVLDEVLQDWEYYEASGGGVTLSGGEVLLQPEFALALLEALRAEGCRTAVETNLNADFSVLASLLPYLDLVLCDVKLLDPEAHRRWTGAGNGRILENLRRLSGSGAPFAVRTPVIPGVNDNEAEIGAIAELVGGLPGLIFYELLNFNPLGGTKYDALDLENPFRDAKPLPEERMDQLRSAAEQFCTVVRVG